MTPIDPATRTRSSLRRALLVVLAVGLGFAAYGLFCLSTFTHRELEAP